MYRPHRINVRLGDAGKGWLDQTRREHDVTEADVIRAALAVAQRHPTEVDDRIRTMKETR